MMKGLIVNPGKYRNKSVGIVKGVDVEHVAPPFKNVPFLMKSLFTYLKKSDEIALIKAVSFITKWNLFIHFLMETEELEDCGKQLF